MKKGKIPTIIGIVLLALGIFAGVFLIRNRQIFKLGASPDASPNDVRITNISDTSFDVSWTTVKETSGFVSWGKTVSTFDRVENSDALGEKGFTHYFTINALTPETNYYFKISSDGNEYDNNGNPWQIKTGSTLSQPLNNILINGSILSATGNVEAKTLVYVIVGGGSPLSTTTSDSGSWLLPISVARNQTLDDYVTIDPKTTLLEISVNAGPDGVASAQIYPQSANPIPEIIIGNSHNFKGLPASEGSGLPNANLQIPSDTATQSSGFNVEQNTATVAAKTVTLDSVDQGEVINTTDPEFFGKGPKGTDITITVESDPQTEQLTVPTTGNWKWSPPADLAPGTHKVTLTWRDAQGILRTLTRDFIVQASEGPAFVSTPSASPRSTASATPTIRPTATARATATASARPTPPNTGSLTPTLVLSIMGIGVIAFGLMLWKMSEAN
jgi:hypothetical protein